MEEHRGSELEKVIRKKGINISELARKIGVNRRSLYNWFKEKNLKSSIVKRISEAINVESHAHSPDNNEVDYWRDKYISLLERYVEVLSDDE